MGNAIKTGLEIIIKIVDAVPILKGYRTAIMLIALGVIFVLDTAGVTTGLYQTVSPIALPLVTATALAHK